MRHCPTLASDDRPLIAQSIQTHLCLSRQRGFYHKCHRCVYRGESADFTIEVAHSNGVAPPYGEFASEENIASSDRLNEVLIDRGQPVADQERAVASPALPQEPAARTRLENQRATRRR